VPSCQTITVTIVGTNFEQIPVFKRVGEIIRIHRCNIGQYKSQKTFFVNMGYGSSWTIFEGIPSKHRKALPQEDEEVLDMSSGDLASENEAPPKDSKTQ